MQRNITHLFMAAGLPDNVQHFICYMQSVRTYLFKIQQQ